MEERSPQIEVFREKHVDEVAKLIQKSFFQLNTIWKTNRSEREITSIIRSKILPCSGGTLSYVLVKDRKIIGAAIQLDYVDYIQTPKIQHSNKMMTMLGKYAQILDQQIPLREGPIKRGEIMYGLYGVIDPEFANKGYSLKFWASQFEIGKVIGYKAYYSRLASDRSYSMLRYIGAEKVSDVDVVETPGSKIYLARLDLGNVMSYDQMANILAMLKAAKKDKKSGVHQSILTSESHAKL